MQSICIITPVYNQVHFIEETIKSVLSQNYPLLEHVIVDGGSTDGTIDIIKKYEGKLHYWVSEPDKGMYDAISKGFSHTSADIMGWINADDVHMPGSLSLLNDIFSQHGEVEWVQGRSLIIDNEGRLVRVGDRRPWSKYDFCLGNYKWIMQESTFWKRTLWDRAGGLDTSLRYAGDFNLWCRFFKYAKLYTTDVLLGAHRAHSDGQLSFQHFDKYLEEVEYSLNILKAEVEKESVWPKIFRYFRVWNKLRHLGFDGYKLATKLKKQLHLLKAYPPHLEYDVKKKRFVTND